MSSVVTLIFNDVAIRASVIGGVPLFVFSDVRYAIGDVCIIVADLHPDERVFIELNSGGRCQRVVAVTLFGLSSLFAFGDPEVVGTFKRWIGAVALPALLSPSTARVLPQPSQADLFTTTEIAEALNMHPVILGKMTKHLKNPRYGERHFAPALYSDAVIEQWFWNSDGRAAVLREFGPSNFRRTRTI